MIVDNYENKNFPIGIPDPISGVEFRMEHRSNTKRFG
jgi:HTH-type transcriptional regulator/antitoxin HigA